MVAKFPRIFIIVLVALAVHTFPSAAQPFDPAQARSARDPIRYTLSFPAPHTHYVEVSAIVPTDRRPNVEMMMAVWTPGSYLVREYSRHVEGFAASGTDGKALPVDKSRKNRWTIASGGAPAVTVRYRVYSREMTVRNNWVESAFAMLNGAPTFITLVEKGPRPHDVLIALPSAWKESVTGLAGLPGGGPHQYRAPDFDTLVDSPIIAGNPAVHEFAFDGKKHYLVNTPATETFDGARAAKDLEKVVSEWKLEVNPAAADTQKQRLTQWLQPATH
jgi:predicted metalloprotease with PDZ domain